MSRSTAGAGHPAEAPHPIDAPGTKESAWAAWPGLNALPGARLADVDSAVIVAAHPDDEVLGTGGLIAALAASGVRLRLVAVTDGEGSHRGRADPVALARRRTAETAAALRALGAGTTDVVRLGLPDSGLADREDELTVALGRLIAGFDLCLAPWDGDTHPDHETAGRAARRAAWPTGRPGAPGARGARGAWFLCYPIWMWHWASPGDRRVPWDRALRVPLEAPAAARKLAAIGCFTSQTEDRGDDLGPVLTTGMIAHFTRATEVLLP